MLGEPGSNLRDRRRAETRAEIISAAWAECRVGGLTSLSLRDLAAAVGMRAPSLYSYFDSKDAIYDAMFQQGQRELAEWMGDVADAQPVTREILKSVARRWFEFCVTDPVRYQLMFQRVLPTFEPSPESYALAIGHVESLTAILHELGITEPAHVDTFTALLTGFTSQQISNDPGGDRWATALNDAVDMFLDHVGVPR